MTKRTGEPPPDGAMFNPVYSIIIALAIGAAGAASHWLFLTLVISAGLLSVALFWLNRDSFKRIMADAPGEPMRLSEWPTIGAIAAIIAAQWLIAFVLMSATYWPARILIWPQNS